MQNKPNIALYGRSGSGKTTVANVLVHEYGYVLRKTGAACRAICLNLFDSDDKTLLNRVTDALREIDSTVWLRAALREKSDSHPAPIVLDSIRFRPDYQYVLNRHFVTIRLEAPANERVERLSNRGQQFDLLTDDLHPAEIELAEATFDFTIINDGSIENLMGKARSLACELRI